MQRLDIITPVTRPENLDRISRSMASLEKYFDVRWHVMLSKKERPGSFGAPERNRALGHITDPRAWVWHLDDDNLVHPNFPLSLFWAVTENPDADGFVFDQDRGNGWILPAVLPAVISKIDTAMFVLRRNVIGDTRWPDGYEHDFHFFNDVARNERVRIVPVSDVAVYHNAINWVRE